VQVSERAQDQHDAAVQKSFWRNNDIGNGKCWKLRQWKL